MIRLLIILASFVVISCSRSSSESNLEINGFNYTDLYIDSFSVNGQGGGNVFVSSTTSGGGGSVCCIRWDKSLTPPVTVNVEWSYDRTTWCSQEVTIEEPFPEDPHHLGIHFFQDGHVEATISEEYPELKLELEHFNFEERKESGNTIPPCSSSTAGNNQVNEPQGNPEWSQPYQPFRIVGNVYYVGTYDLASYLITTREGHILINTGLAASADIIGKNIEALGFNVSDLKILTTNQAHYDHVGAIAALQKLSGAKIMADSKDAQVLSDGGLSDYEMSGNGMMFEPLKIDRELHDNDVIELGNTRLTMLHHPGHTKGSCSFMLDVKDENKTYKVLITNLPTIITGRDLTAIPEYPDISKDIAHTLDALAKLKFDIWLAAHASQFSLHEKHKPGDAYKPQAFVDRAGFDKQVNDLKSAYEKKLAAKN